jgi:pSer/pThr/pTyr-binding forkhead associated (FHA) protein
MTELIIQSGKHRGKRLALPNAQVIIGRDATCQIRVESEEVSRHHCSLRNAPEGLVVRDLGSRNGTFLNDFRIEAEAVLKPGDTLRVGPMQFQLPGRAEPRGPEATPPPGKPARLTEDDMKFSL